MCNYKEADLFCDQVGLALRLLNDSCWLIRCARSKLPVLWWGAQGTANNTVTCSQVDWCSLCACQLLWEHGCLKVPWSSFGAPSVSPGAPQCQLQRRLLSLAACLPGLCWSWRAWRVVMGSVKPSGWDLLFSCQKAIYFLPVANLSDAAVSGLLLELLNHPDS